MTQSTKANLGALFARLSNAQASGLPKYMQLRDSILEAIRSGHWAGGEQLPTEVEFTRNTPYSLGTVQRSLRALVEAGIIVRTQGSGTYVAPSRASIEEPLHLRFLGTDGEPRFLPLFPEVIERMTETRAGPWDVLLNAPGDGDIVRIDRRLNVNHEFNVYSQFYFNARQFPTVARTPINRLDGVNLKQILGQSLGLPITTIHQSICLITLPTKACRVTGAKHGTKGMLLESVAMAGRDTPVYFLHSYIPDNGRKLDCSMTAERLTKSSV